MNDEMSPEVTEALRSALGHLESQAPIAPQLPTGPLLRARRFWPKPAIALAALVALPGPWWLRSVAKWGQGDGHQRHRGGRSPNRSGEATPRQQ